MKATLGDVLYITGHLLSTVMYRFDITCLYGVYNELMIRSYQLGSRFWKKEL